MIKINFKTLTVLHTPTMQHLLDCLYFSLFSFMVLLLLFQIEKLKIIVRIHIIYVTIFILTMPYWGACAIEIKGSFVLVVNTLESQKQFLWTVTIAIKYKWLLMTGGAKRGESSTAGVELFSESDSKEEHLNRSDISLCSSVHKLSYCSIFMIQMFSNQLL